MSRIVMVYIVAMLVVIGSIFVLDRNAQITNAIFQNQIAAKTTDNSSDIQKAFLPSKTAELSIRDLLSDEATADILKTIISMNAELAAFTSLRTYEEINSEIQRIVKANAAAEELIEILKRLSAIGVNKCVVPSHELIDTVDSIRRNMEVFFQNVKSLSRGLNDSLARERNNVSSMADSVKKFDRAHELDRFESLYAILQITTSKEEQDISDLDDTVTDIKNISDRCSPLEIQIDKK